MESILGLPLPVEDPILIFGICMVVILVAPLLFERFKLPGLIGPIVAGVVLGTSVLNVLERGQAIELLGNVGLLYIMFLSGLEINMSQFRKNRDRSFVFGVITFTIPQVAGTLIFHYLLGFDWIAAILIASMFASHTLVPYPIISRLGIMKNDAVVTTVGGTILTDTVALLVLVVVARAFEGELTTMFWVSLALAMVIYVTAVVYLLPPLARWFFRNVEDGGKSEFVFVLAVVFIGAYLARAVIAEETEAEDTESSVAAAERLLAHAVVHAVELDLPVNPVTRVARNLASGVVEAAMERRISDIVIGWNGTRSARQRIFGSVIDQMLEQAPQQVWVCKVNHPVSTFQRLLVVLPPVIDHNPGFYEGVRSLKHLAYQLGASLQMLVVSDGAEPYRQHFEDVAIEVTTGLIEVPTWDEARATLKDAAKDQDLIVLMSAREGTVAYDRALERLPQLLADSQLSFLVLYPSEKDAQYFGAAQPLTFGNLLSQERVLLNLTTTSYEATVDALLSTVIDRDDPRHRNVLKALAFDDVGYASEVLPGVIISHARVPKLKHTRLCLSVHCRGIQRGDQPIYVVVLLLTPAQGTTQDHLAQLASVAQYFSHGDIRDKLITCSNVEDLEGLLEPAI